MDQKLQKIADKFLKDNESDHFNFVDRDEYKTSTGSLKLDSSLGGGLPPGVHRFCGATEAGKTSASFEVARNFMKEHGENAIVIYIKAEGRLSTDIQTRTGLKFTTKPSDWDHETVFVYKCNIYDTIVKFIDSIVNLYREDNEKRILVIIDSLDGLIRKEDFHKEVGEKTVAGVPYMTNNFMKKYALALTELCHTLILISQVRAKIRIDMYAPGDKQKSTSGSGGNAAMHFATWILDFVKSTSGSYITLKDGEPNPIKNPILGHYVKVRIEKSTNETTGYSVIYPVKHHRKGCSSIWIEKEVIEMLVAHELLVRSGSWFSFSEDAFAIMGAEIEIPEEMSGKIQGLASFEEKLYTNKEVLDFWYNYFLDLLSNKMEEELSQEEPEEVEGEVL